MEWIGGALLALLRLAVGAAAFLTLLDRRRGAIEKGHDFAPPAEADAPSRRLQHSSQRRHRWQQ